MIFCSCPLLTYTLLTHTLTNWAGAEHFYLQVQVLIFIKMQQLKIHAEREREREGRGVREKIEINTSFSVLVWPLTPNQHPLKDYSCFKICQNG